MTSPGGVIFNNFGVGLVGTSKDNLIEKNKIGGNLNGVLIMATTQGGNVIRRNIIAGNPPGSFSSSSGADIQDLSAAGANTFEDNRCITYAGQTMPAPCPNISNRDNDEDRLERDIAAFGRNRLAWPQPRLIDAIFRRGGAALPETLADTKSPPRGLSRPYYADR